MGFDPATPGSYPELKADAQPLSHLGFPDGPRLFLKIKIKKKKGGTMVVKIEKYGHLGGSVVEHLPSAQGMTPGSWDRVPHRAPHRETASPSLCVSASLPGFLMNK